MRRNCNWATGAHPKCKKDPGEGRDPLSFVGRRSGQAHPFLILRDRRPLVDQRQCLHRCGRGSKHLLFPTHVRKPAAPCLSILGLYAGVSAEPNRDLLLRAVIDHQHAAIRQVVLPEAGRCRRSEPRSRHDLVPIALIDPTGIGRSRVDRSRVDRIRVGWSRGDRVAATIAGAAGAEANSAATTAATADIVGLVDGLIDRVARPILVDLVARAALVGLVTLATLVGLLSAVAALVGLVALAALVGLVSAGAALVGLVARAALVSLVSRAALVGLVSAIAALVGLVSRAALVQLVSAVAALVS